MKHSPLCTRDNGKEVMFTAREDGLKYRFVAPRALLDEVCGDTADAAVRKKWVGAQIADILALRGADTAKPPLDRITVEEIT